MPSFGIVAEGITDQIVIDNVITGYFGDQDEEPAITYVQPLLDATGEKEEPGGWTLVFQFLEQRRYREALQYNDYLVIHIDTDVSKEAGFDVFHHEQGRELSVPELAARVRQRLERVIGAEDVAKYAGRLVFAIAVHGIECWLLPLLYQDNHAGKITGCLRAANYARSKRNQKPLSTVVRDRISKDPRSYRDVSREYTKRKRLMALCDKNPSLALFVRQLDQIGAPAAPAANAPPASDAPAAPAAPEQ